jgi:hypothetical protein
MTAFLAAAALDPRGVFISSQQQPVDAEEAWRTAALRRYSPGTWKHTILEMIPWRVFAPADVHRPNRKVLLKRYPRHTEPETGTNVTINELVRDRVLVKVGRAQYAPAVNGVAAAGLS